MISANAHSAIAGRGWQHRRSGAGRPRRRPGLLPAASLAGLDLAWAGAV
jgi:hypothetical protein